jgi:hypothetical protein
MTRDNAVNLDVKPDQPLRLNIAAALAYPDGSMTASGLRKEAAKGRLVIERTAGKDYTTLASIQRMRELCRLQPKGPDCGSEKQDATNAAASVTPPYGSSSMENIRRARSAATAIVEGLKGNSKPTSTASTPRRRKKASVIPIKSPLQMS